MQCETEGDWNQLINRLGDFTRPGDLPLQPLITQLTIALQRVEEAADSRCADPASSSARAVLTAKLDEFLSSLALFVGEALPPDARRGLRCQSFELLVDSARKTLHSNYPTFDLRRALADRGTRFENRHVNRLHDDPTQCLEHEPDPHETVRELRSLASAVIESVLSARQTH